ncbi:hypothetical protein D3C87_1712810 [compost metagenome]
MNPEKRVFPERVKFFVERQVIFIFQVRRVFGPDRAWVVDNLVFELDFDRQEFAVLFQNSPKTVLIEEFF